MKAVILAGGFGTRISEETSVKPKPMVEIGGKPILWHIMKIYSAYGINDFVICLGYKGYMIKEYFANYYLHTSDVTFDMRENRMEVHENKSEPWSVTLVDTGDNTMTGGRLKRVARFLDDGPFCFTYGDGLSNVDIRKLANTVDEMLRKMDAPVKVAVMGCEVNGPGEAKDADVGIAAGNGRAVIFRKGIKAKVVDEADMLTALMVDCAAELGT